VHSLQSFHIVANHGALPIELGATKSQVNAILGAPQVRTKNFQGKEEDFYGNVNIAYSENGTVIHIGLVPGCHVDYRGLDAFGEAAMNQMMEDDGAPMKAFDIIYLLRLGISLSGFHDRDSSQKALTLFAKGEHDSLIPRMTPFVPKRI
jgi:hypothetical protein